MTTTAQKSEFPNTPMKIAGSDMPEIGPLFATLSRMLIPGAAFVFSVTHPCFHSPAIERFTEICEEQTGRHVIRSGVKVSSYLSPFARKTEGIVGRPEPQWFFHRPLRTLFRFGFEAGFVVDGIEEPQFAEHTPRAGVRWHDMPDIPPIMVVRMRLLRHGQPAAGEALTRARKRDGLGQEIGRGDPAGQCPGI